MKDLQKRRNTVLITYFTLTDRANIPQLNVADDALRPLHRLLERIGQKESMDLFIYTRGGSMMTAYSIVKMLREFSRKLNVLVPFRCHSAGTQIALGADSISMTSIAQLGPADPSTANFFSPLLSPQSDPLDFGQRKPISVEDVQAYLNLAKERVGLVSEGDSLEVFKELTKHYEPLALGDVYRLYRETRVLAKEILSLHMDAKNDEEKIEQIVKALTETYTHEFPITRDTAEKIGLKVVHPGTDETNLLMQLYQSYEHEMRMHIPFDADAYLHSQVPVGTQDQGTQLVPLDFRAKLGAIESMDDSYAFVSDGVVWPAPSNSYPPTPLVTFKTGSWRNITQLAGMQFV